MNRTVVFVANRGYALLSSRKSIITQFLQADWKVVIATADDDESRELVDLGAILEPTLFNRGGLSLFSDLSAYKRLKAVYKKWRPSLIHHFHAKPVIAGTIAAKNVLGDATVVVNTITGLGHAFIMGGVISHLAGLGYRFSLPAADMTIFQNRDDLALFLKNSWVRERNSKLIVGSGIDVRNFSFSGREGRDALSPVVIMLGRLLGQKGIGEFVKVAGAIKERWPKARFLLAGEEDLAHPDSVTAEWVRGHKCVEYQGRLDDVAPLLQVADILLFPSYREGVPRAVMEAAATGLPTVAYCVPGVKEAVANDQTGYLVPFGNIDELIAKTSRLIMDQNERLTMGRAARDLAVRYFDINVIEESYLGVYREQGVDI